MVRSSLRRALALAIPLAAALALSACDKWRVIVETRVDEAGRLSRETVIEYTGSKDDTEDRVGPVFRVPDDGSVTDRSARRVASQRLARSPSELTPDVVLAGERSRRPAQNAVDWRIERCVLFDRYVYRETIHDSVTAAEREEALERFGAFVAEIALEAIAAEAGESYALDRFEAWLVDRFRPLAKDWLALTLLEKDEDRRARFVVDRLAREGFELPSAEALDDQALLLRLAAERIAALLDPREGVAPFDPEELLTRELADDGTEHARLERLIADAAERIHGSIDATADALRVVLEDAQGELSRRHVEFEHRVTLPGRPWRTNGALEPPDARETAALFRFGSRDAASTGYAIELESVVDRPEMLAFLARPKAQLSASDTEAVLDVLLLVDADGRAALEAAWRRLSDEPVDAVAKTLPAEHSEVLHKLIAIGSRAAP